MNDFKWFDTLNNIFGHMVTVGLLLSLPDDGIEININDGRVSEVVFYGR